MGRLFLCTFYARRGAGPARPRRGGTIVGMYLKDLGACLDYAIDWSETLCGATIAESQWTIEPNEPGGVRAIAEAGGKRAEVLMASLDPATTSVPVPMPSGLPIGASESQRGARLVTDAAGWNGFVDEIRPATGTGAIAPPVDLAKHSLVAVVLDALPNTGAPVVTHIEPGAPETVQVVQPRVIGYRVPEPAGYVSGVITLLSIPKVSADAKVNLRSIAPTAQ